MGKRLYIALVCAIAITTSLIFFIASIISLREIDGFQISDLGPLVISGAVLSAIVVILAGIAEKYKS